jgi:DNA-binding YbaB/EbfC family protein
MFKGIGQFASLMKNAHEIQGRMKEMQETLRRLKVEGVSGGGMVKIEMSGQQQVLGCQIEPSLFTSGDRELLEDLIVAATNQALEKLKQTTAEQMERMTGGLDVPAINNALSQLGLGADKTS